MYIHSKRNPITFLNDSLIVYDRINDIFKIFDYQIFANDMSLSPAIYLSSQRQPTGLFLICAFSSIKKGLIKMLSYFSNQFLIQLIILLM